jgi:Mn-dependent DtxR family transcriptional regulator
MDKNEQKGAAAMHIQESGEMYLESIYVLSQTGKPVRSVDVSEYLGYSKPSVSRAVGLLKKGGYILMDKDGSLTLTEAGRDTAEKIYARHTLISRVLIALGVSPETAAADACKIEHAISDESFDALKAYIEKTST